MGHAGTGAPDETTACFLAFSGEPTRLRKWLSSLVPEPNSSLRLNRILDCADLVVYASPETPVTSLNGGKGVLLGHPFERRAVREAGKPSILAEALAVAVRGDLGLLDPPAGDYAAFLRFRRSVVAIRGPGGGVAVHHFEAGDVAAFLSHRELGRRLEPKSSAAAISLGSEQPNIGELEPGAIQAVITSRGGL